jgi:hypothetical protein
MNAVFECMKKHDLEHNRTTVSADYSSIFWEDGFNKTRTIELRCFNSGLVAGFADDSADRSEKIWWVSDLLQGRSLPNFEDILLLTLDETLEYVRHFIWANHNV